MGAIAESLLSRGAVRIASSFGWVGDLPPTSQDPATQGLVPRREAPRSTCTQVSVGMRGA